MIKEVYLVAAQLISERLHTVDRAHRDPHHHRIKGDAGPLCIRGGVRHVEPPAQAVKRYLEPRKQRIVRVSVPAASIDPLFHAQNTRRANTNASLQ